MNAVSLSHAGRRLFVLLAALALPVAGAAADAARRMVEQGNRLYREGQYAEALAAYEDAGVEAPESARIDFNQGLALYRQDDLARAGEAFRKADSRAKGVWLQSRSKYNLGNIAFREGERRKDSEIEKALGGYERSIRLYQAALDLDPEFTPAAENIEVTRRVMKALMDELKKQQEEAQQQQQAQQEAARKIEELLERQQDALQANRELSEKKDAGDEGEEALAASPELGAQQRELAEDTQKMADEVQAQQQQQPPQPSASGDESPLEQVRQHLDRAVEDQRQAADKLEANQGREAEPGQEKAAEELAKALEALQGSQDGQKAPQPSPQQDGEQAPDGEESPPPSPDPEDGQRPPEGAQEGAPEGESEPPPEEAMLPVADEARDILDEEAENQERRRVRGGVRPVDKDW